MIEFRYSVPQIAQLLADNLEDLIGYLGLDRGIRDGNDIIMLNPGRPGDKHRGSFRLTFRGPWRGRWHEFAGDFGGDALDLIMLARGGSKTDAIKEARKFLRLDCDNPPAPPVVAPRAPVAEIDKTAEFARFWAEDPKGAECGKKALGLWLSGNDGSLRDTPVDLYLKNRGIDLAVLGKSPTALRYHPALPYYEDGQKVGEFPAMVALAQGPDGKPRAVHRTYLEQNGGVWVKKALRSNKKMSGPYGGAFIPIWRGMRPPMAKIEEEERIYVTEGIEDALSVALAVPEFRVVCGISVSNIKHILFPSAVREIVLAADNDEAGSPADQQVEKTIRELSGRGHRVFVARSLVGKDFNDWLKEKESEQ